MDLRAEARRAAKRHGLDPDIFERQIGAESSFDVGAHSSAGAIGVAQIMPGTARAWHVNPRDPKAALDAAAKHMALYVKQYGGYAPALHAYISGNPTGGGQAARDYVSKILGGSDPGGGGVSTPSSSDSSTTLFGQGPDLAGQAKRSAVMNFLERGSSPLTLAKDVKAAESLPSPQDVTVPGDTPAASTSSAHGFGGGDLATIGNQLDSFGRRLGATVGSGGRSAEHNAAVGGAQDSDHLEEPGRWARDYPSRGEQRTAIAKRFAERFGIPFKPDAISQGNVKIGKHTYRVQVIEGAAVDHADHVHVGLRLVS